MNILTLPPKKDRNDPAFSLQIQNAIIIGANGSGKTRMGAYIQELNYGRVERISAQKSLSLPVSSHSSSIDEARLNHEFGMFQANWGNSDPRYFDQWKIQKYQNKPATYLVDDFRQLMVLLFTEEFEHALKFRETQQNEGKSKMQIIKEIWESIIPTRILHIKSGRILVSPSDNLKIEYNASEMSDGERVIIYLIGKVLCAKQNALIIIDEPEMHIHGSIMNQFFDLLEIQRPDCSFIYLTHNIDFAFNRTKTKIIWVKSYKYKLWDYEILPDESPIPEALYLSILGNRKNILFIEGDEGSLDQRLYERVFPDFSIKPLGSCEKVIHITKSFNQQKSFHNLSAYGIIDRDLKEELEIESLNNHDIWVLEYAEVENLLLMEPIIKEACQHMTKPGETIFEQVKESLFEFFKKQIEIQKKFYYKKVFREEILKLSSIDGKNISELREKIGQKLESLADDEMVEEIEQLYNKISSTGDYDLLLKFFNPKRKSLIANSKICNHLGLKKTEDYEDLVLNLIRKDNQNEGILSKKIKQKLFINVNSNN